MSPQMCSLSLKHCWFGNLICCPTMASSWTVWPALHSRGLGVGLDQVTRVGWVGRSGCGCFSLSCFSLVLELFRPRDVTRSPSIGLWSLSSSGLSEGPWGFSTVSETGSREAWSLIGGLFCCVFFVKCRHRKLQRLGAGAPGAFGV